MLIALGVALCAGAGCSGDGPAPDAGGGADVPRNTFAGEPFSPNDPYFPYDPTKPLHPGQWNLHNQAPRSIHYPATVAPNGHQTAEVTISNVGLDAHIVPVWSAGYTGRGIIIGILDNGVELGHPDLDIVRELSTGMDSKGIVAGQTGAHHDDSASHGTNVAGMAAAIGGNGIGVCGLAPHARIASVVVDNFTTIDEYCMHPPFVYWQAGLGWIDQMDSAALARLTSLGSAPVIQVKNSSSKTAQFVYPVDFSDTYSAFARTAANGMLFTQAAGNSRATEQQDANTSMEKTCPYVITVAAMGSDGRHALYSSFGSPVFVAVLSESAWWNLTHTPIAPYANGLGVSSTDRFGAPGNNYDSNGTAVFLPDLEDLAYTNQFDGTSAAAPSLAGMLAVAKQANPNLNLRMAKHLLARTSRVVDPDDRSSSSTWTVSDGRRQSGWQTNGAGFRFNPDYGFGLPDVTGLVSALLRTAYVTDETVHHTGLLTVPAPQQTIVGGDAAGSTRTVDITVPASVRQSLESVEVYVELTGQDRREVQVVLSKGTTSSRLLTPGNECGQSGLLVDDPNPSGGIAHFFLSNAFWGEDPDGTWSVTVCSPTGTHTANWLRWGIVLHMGELTFEGAGGKQTISARTVLGLSLNRSGTHLQVPSAKAVECAGDVQVNAGTLEVAGTLCNSSSVTVTRLDPTFSATTEALSYDRGVRVEIAGGLLTGSGTVIAPPGTDGRGGFFNTHGTVRPGQEDTVATLKLGSPSKVTSYFQGRDGTLTIDVHDPQSFGRLEVHGTMTLGGTLRVITADTANVLPGTRLENVVSAATVTGSFDTVWAAISGPPGLHWRPVVRSTGIDLVAEL
ncbi:MAG: S8 family serine peptidase [Candidatus Riflebacteria bacterium]|nr:S8 family serine peptidase [Candidatus Riflebacteria bacterium]